jgi:hypothetical protein
MRRSLVAHEDGKSISGCSCGCLEQELEVTDDHPAWRMAWDFKCFGSYNLREREHLEDEVFDGRFVFIREPRHDGVVGKWRYRHKEELHNLYPLPYIVTLITSMWMGWVDYVACMGEMGNSYKILVRKPEGKIQPRILKHRQM